MSGASSITVLGHAASPQLLRPRISALSNGVALGTPASATVTRTNYSRGDTFSAVIPVGPAPYWFDPPDPADGSAGAEIDVQIQSGFLPDGAAEGSAPMTNLVQGTVSDISIDLDGGWVTVTCRDYSSRLIDHQLNGEAFLNVSASDAIASLAATVGLQADVDATQGLVGQYYQIEHKHGSLTKQHKYTTAWDFCVAMQRLNGFDLWVDGKTVHFKKPLADTTPPLALTWQDRSAETPYPTSRIAGLRLTRRLLLSRGIVVTVTSFDPRQRSVHSATWPNHPKQDATPYAFQAPPGTQIDTLKQIAAQRYAEVVAHARTATGTISIHHALSPRRRVTLATPVPSFNQTYWVDSVVTTISATTAAQAITLRNRGDLAALGDGSDA